ncbi:MAG: NAD+ synthase [Candidatus Eisenbacteria bacterium]|nr:NAD+ synthase [Candidatus Eisenbacteria bacterium]
MRQLRLGLAQINPTVGDLDGNFDRVVAWIEKARARSVDVLAFPEMVITGYPPEDLLLKPSFIERAMDRTRALGLHTKGMTVVVGTVDRDFDLYNAAAVLHDGEWVGTYRKRYLPNYGVFDENRYFMPGNRNPVFVRGGTVLGVNICEDIWYPGGPVEEQVIRGGAEIIINLSASPYHAGKAQARRRMLCTRAADNLAVVCYVNLVGGQDEIVYDGASLIVDEQGQVVAEGDMFAEDLILADLDFEAVFNARLHDPRLRKGRALDPGETSPRVDLPMSGTIASPAAAAAGTASSLATPAAAGATPAPSGGGAALAVEIRPALERRPVAIKRELVPEIYDALVLGTRDYVRKNRFATVVLGLSGGVDSALCACVAADALGHQNVVGVAMPSRFTSGASREDAEALARALQIRFYSIPIHDVFDAYRGTLEPAFSGAVQDITEENLQARIRGNYLMALSNKFGWLVLTTGNKSEVSVGYSTLYGDTAGGFAVLKDVYKTMVYQLAQYRRTLGGAAAIPERTLTRPPSAELRPDQTDQDSLPPYDVLDPILRLHVEEDRSVAEIAELGYEIELVRKIVAMVDRAEYKRRQSPPGIKITPRAFGKDRRLPITNRWVG